MRQIDLELDDPNLKLTMTVYYTWDVSAAGPTSRVLRKQLEILFNFFFQEEDNYG